MFSSELDTAAQELILRCLSQGKKIVVAESCTGGLLSGLLTSIAGSSKVLERGFVTYSNEAKVELLGVDPELILAHGAVSANVAAAMAQGALHHSHADISLAITGIAGPGGGTADKPVGLVYFGIATRNAPVGVQKHRFGEVGRAQVREAAVTTALQILAGL